jgi:hypothetical protein
MIGVLTFWETFVGVDNPIYLADIWKDTIKPLGATNLFYIDEEGLNPKHGDESLPCKIYPALDDFIAEHKDKTLVYLEAKRNIPEAIKYQELKDFKHPKENVIYLLGKDSSSLPLETLPLKSNFVVSISTRDNLALWSIVVAGIVLYDRKVKQ